MCDHSSHSLHYDLDFTYPWAFLPQTISDRDGIDIYTTGSMDTRLTEVSIISNYKEVQILRQTAQAGVDGTPSLIALLIYSMKAVTFTFCLWRWNTNKDKYVFLCNVLLMKHLTKMEFKNKNFNESLNRLLPSERPLCETTSPKKTGYVWQDVGTFCSRQNRIF